MAKKKSWFDRLKRFLGSDTKPKQEKKEKRKRYFFARFKSKRLPSLPAPYLRRARSLSEAEDAQSKHAVAVAIATAAAAEAAVAAAQAAAQVVRLTGKPLSYHRAQEIAAIRIQTAFRGYLAKSALKALRGLVKLQALIRGQTIRRQTTATLKGLQSLVKIQSQARANRVRALVDCEAHDFKETAKRTTKNLEVMNSANGERKWDNSVLSHEEMLALLNNKREAALKRDRAMEYALAYQDRRRPPTPIHSKFNPDIEDRRWSWLEEWVGAQPLNKDSPEIFSTPKEKAEESQLRFLARRSFIQSRKNSIKDDDSFSSSPNIPSYMAPTASANARFRSLSMPKQRTRTIETCSEQHCTPYNYRVLSPLPSITSDAGSAKVSKSLKSPRMKTKIVTGQLKCSHSSNDLIFDSERSLLKWNQNNACR